MDEWAYLKGATYSVTFELAPRFTKWGHCETGCTPYAKVGMYSYTGTFCQGGQLLQGPYNNCGDVMDYKCYKKELEKMFYKIF